MEEFLNYLIPLLITDKEQFKVVKSDDSTGEVVFEIHVAKDDMGRIIGKEGKIINAIRNLLKILAVKEKKKVTLNIAEPS